MAVFPQLFTNTDPTYADLPRPARRRRADAWFGYDIQGCDIYARTVYGARASILVGVFATVGHGCCIGSVVGIIAGYYGGWVDALLSPDRRHLLRASRCCSAASVPVHLPQRLRHAATSSSVRQGGPRAGHPRLADASRG